MKTQPRLKTALVLLLALMSTTSARAVLFLDVGSFNLAPDTAGQQISFFYTADASAAVAGLEFNLQIADGGTEVGGSVSGPSITSIDLVTGTIFDGLSPNVSVDAAFPQIQVHSLDLDSGAADVTTGGPLLLATATIDTTGFYTLGQTWDLLLGGTLNGDTTFFDGGANPLGFDTINNGSLQLTISAVPEPEEYALMAGLGLVLFAAVRRHRARQAGNAG